MANTTAELEDAADAAVAPLPECWLRREEATDFRILPDAHRDPDWRTERHRTAPSRGSIPLVDEIVAARKAHKLLIGNGAGTRARHLYSIGPGLRLPAGVISKSAPRG